MGRETRGVTVSASSATDSVTSASEAAVSSLTRTLFPDEDVLPLIFITARRQLSQVVSVCVSVLLLQARFQSVSTLPTFGLQDSQ